MQPPVTRCELQKCLDYPSISTSVHIKSNLIKRKTRLFRISICYTNVCQCQFEQLPGNNFGNNSDISYPNSTGPGYKMRLRQYLTESFDQNLIPTSHSLSDETLSRGPVFLDALKSEPLPVEPSVLLDIKPQNHKPTGPVLVIAKEHGHKQYFYSLWMHQRGFCAYATCTKFVCAACADPESRSSRSVVQLFKVCKGHQ